MKIQLISKNPQFQNSSKKPDNINYSRTDLRISIMMPLKIMLFCLWYLVIDDDSKYTKVAIGINLVSWPIYHFFIVIIELQYMFDGDLPPGIRTSFYRFADQLQNFILLIEFCVLVFDQQYETAFHIVILTFLILDFVVFAITLLYNLVNNFIRQVQYCRYLDSLPQNSQQLADRIATQIIGEIKSEQQNEELPIYFNKKQEQLKQLQQQHFQQNICSHIQLELNNQVMQQYQDDINFTISMTEDQLLMFQQNLSPQYSIRKIFFQKAKMHLQINRIIKCSQFYNKCLMRAVQLNSFQKRIHQGFLKLLSLQQH